MKIYVVLKMDTEIVKNIPSHDGCIGVVPVFTSLESLKKAFGEDVKYKEFYWEEHPARAVSIGLTASTADIAAADFNTPAIS